MSNNQSAPQAPAGPTGSAENKRLNKLPLIIAFAVFFAFVVLVIYSLSERDAEYSETNKQDKPKYAANNDVSMATIKQQADYIKEQKRLEEKAKKPELPAVTPEQLLNNNEIVENQAPVINFEGRPQKIEPINSDEMSRIENDIDPRFEEYAKMRREKFREALYAKPTTYANNNNTTHRADVVSVSPNASYEEKMRAYNQQIAQLNQYQKDPTANFNQQKEVQKMLNQYAANGYIDLPNTPNNSSSQSSTTNTTNTTNGNANRWHLGNSMEAATPLTITTGFVIPAVLITGINSDLQGRIIGQVSQNVYDSATGRYLLIPQGTKLFGIYKSEIAFGQERVMVAWNRLVFPDARTFDIGEMGGSDLAGYSGFSDLVNNHYWKLFKGALLMSFVTAGVTYSDNKYNRTNNNEANTATSAMAQSLGQELGQVSTELIRKHMNVSPTIEIRNGYRFNVIVTKDITFDRPYALFSR